MLSWTKCWTNSRYAGGLRRFDIHVMSMNVILACSAGVGRTGTFLALDYLLDQAQAEAKVDVVRYTTLMRCNRINMIQTVVSWPWRRVNPCYEEFIWGNLNMDLYFLSFLKSGMAQVHVVDISPRKGKGIACMCLNPALLIGRWWCVVSQCISGNGID